MGNQSTCELEQGWLLSCVKSQRETRTSQRKGILQLSNRIRVWQFKAWVGMAWFTMAVITLYQRIVKLCRGLIWLLSECRVVKICVRDCLPYRFPLPLAQWPCCRVRKAPLSPHSRTILTTNEKPGFPCYRPIASKHTRLGLVMLGFIIGVSTAVNNFEFWAGIYIFFCSHLTSVSESVAGHNSKIVCEQSSVEIR